MFRLSNRRESFDFGWKFYKGDLENAWQTNFSDDEWRTINLPHDWSIEGPFHTENPAGGDGAYLPMGIGWYRKHFAIPVELEGKSVCIEFDGVYMNSDVWVNGHYLGKNVFGYIGFHYDLTPHLNYGGNNVIAVRVDNSEQPNSRWYSGSGIYRHTWLTCTDKLCVARWGTSITTPDITEEMAAVRVSTKVENQYSTPQNVLLSTRILDADGKEIARQQSEFIMNAGSTHEFEQDFIVVTPCLWNIEQPYLYKAYSEIICEGIKKDSYETSFGIRKVRFDCNEGFFLNDQPVKIQGVCLHADGGCVGMAVPERVWERRLEILKKMGCNAIRTSHHPATPELLDMMDRMGFLVMEEAFDEWTICKRKNGLIGTTEVGGGSQVYGYYQHFEQFGEMDLIRMLHRDRNHPCIVIWSVGNEVPEQKKEYGVAIAGKLVEICHKEDPSRPVTVACDLVHAEPFGTYDEFLGELDVVGYNYSNRWRHRAETYHLEDHIRFPQWKIIGSEHASIVDVRGNYMVNREEYRKELLRAEHLWKFTKVNNYVAGDFMWTGIDYLGESRWPYKNHRRAPIDMCGFLKDSFYFYQSQWTEKPMLHLFPHWNFEGREGEVIPVMCFTNCDTVELFVNGKSYGQKCYQFPRQGMAGKWNNYSSPQLPITTLDLHLSWDIPYEPGTLRAIGKKAGEIVCETEIVTTGSPSRVEMIPDRDIIAADGRDVSHITVRITDEFGNTVPDADHTVTFFVEGEGALIGVDNGKPDSHEDFQVNYRNAFNGLCLAIVQSTKVPGETVITASSHGLMPHTVRIKSKKTE